jgi:hypothetical protein
MNYLIFPCGVILTQYVPIFTNQQVFPFIKGNCHQISATGNVLKFLPTTGEEDT